MTLFQREQSYLGVDIGKGSIKVVELKNDKGRARLLTYGFVEQKASEVIAKDFVDNPQYTGKLIKKICDKSGASSKKVIAALPIFSVFSSIINLTNVSKKELSNSKLLSGRIEWEAKKIIPLPLEEMVLDWKLLPEMVSKNKANKEQSSSGVVVGEQAEEKPVSPTIKEKLQGVKILLTAAPKKLVEKYMEIFKSAGLELLSLETEAFAFIRSLVGGDKSPLMVLDSGAGRSSIAIIDKGIPYLNRSIDVGGALITRVLAERLHMNMEQAEQFKLDMAEAPQQSKVDISDLISVAINPIVNEFRYSLNIYKSQEGREAKSIEKIIVTGGVAMLPNFIKSLSQQLNMRVYIGDPWSRVIYPEDLKPLLDELGPRFSVAIGLAMRDIE